MSEPEKVDVQFHFQRRGKNKVLVEGKEPPKPVKPKGRLPRITRYMALAIYYEDLIRQGHVYDYAEIATLGHVTRARVTQIMNLRLLSPNIQEIVLGLPFISKGRDSLCLRQLQPIALESDWQMQIQRWTEVALPSMSRELNCPALFRKTS